MYKTKPISIVSILFYAVLFLNQYVTTVNKPDYILHLVVNFFMWITVRENSRFNNKLDVILSWISFSAKFLAIVVQILFLSFGLNQMLYYCVMIFFVVITFFIEVRLYFFSKLNDFKKRDKAKCNNYIDTYFKQKVHDERIFSELYTEEDNNRMKKLCQSGLNMVIWVLAIFLTFGMYVFYRYTSNNDKMQYVMIGLIIILGVCWHFNMKLTLSVWKSISVCVGMSFYYIFNIYFYEYLDIWRMLVLSILMYFLLPTVMVMSKISIEYNDFIAKKE